MKARQDVIVFLRSITLPRLWNLALLSGSFLLSRILRRDLHRGRPASLSIEPTGNCNLRCPECPTGLSLTQRVNSFMPLGLYRNIIDQLAGHAFSVSLYFQGEPFLHPDLPEMIRYATSRRLYTVLSTNGQLLEKWDAEELIASGLCRLIVSADGTDQATYEKYRIGGNLQKQVQGMQNLAGTRKRMGSMSPLLVLQYLVMRQNEKDLPQLRRWASSLGADRLELKSAQILSGRDTLKLLPVEKEFNRYNTDTEGRLQLKSALPRYCWRSWHAAVITCDGILLPCCFDKDLQHSPGNVQTASLDSLLTNETVHAFRRAILQNRENIEMCQNCTEGLRIRTARKIIVR